jgi:hypothetical protein
VNARHQSYLRTLALFAVMVGCAPLPDLTFASSDGGAGVDPSRPDATLPGMGMGPDAADPDDGAADDAGIGPEAAPMDLVDDAGDGAATIKCRSGTVSNCGNCSGLHLRCKKGAVDECLADCSSCGANWLPCLHCPNSGAPAHGQCLPVGQNGQVACAKTNLCACNADTDCTQVPNSAQTCDLLSGSAKGACLPCGAAGTNGAACLSASGVAGTCQIDAGAVPRCQ